LFKRYISLIFVPTTVSKVKLKGMEKAKKSFGPVWKGAYQVIGRKVGCSPKYVAQVLRNKLGKYNERDTRLVRRIREVAEEMERILEPAED
jgi:hypothetical protein